MSIADNAVAYLREQHLLLTTAESCTAGKIVTMLSEVEGSGSFIECGYVVYSPQAKQRLLHVSPHTIETFNLTSVQVAGEMATFTDKVKRRPPVFPPYDHDDLQKTFAALITELRRDIERDEFGRVTAFNLTDSTGIVWRLEYQAFFPDSLALPKRMLLQSSDSQIKLVIRSWQ